MIHLDHRVVGIEQRRDRSVTLRFANGKSVEADGCCLRRRAFLRQGAIVWQGRTNFTGRIAYRTGFRRHC